MDIKTAKTAKPVTDLELYEILVAAYPDKFDEDAEGDIWDEVMEFAEEFSDIDSISDLLGRLIYLTQPMESAISGKAVHCIGKVKINDGNCYMTAAAKREISLP